MKKILYIAFGFRGELVDNDWRLKGKGPQAWDSRRIARLANRTACCWLGGEFPGKEQRPKQTGMILIPPHGCTSYKHTPQQ